jgi:ketosteroid isomerase-like protein
MEVRAMKRLLVCLCVVTACRAAPLATPADTTPPTPTQVDQAVKSRIEQYRQGYEVRSLDALIPIYSKTDDLTLTVQGRTQRGWPQVQEWLGAFLGKATTVKLRMAELQVVTLGDTGALATMVMHRTYGDGVTTIDEEGTLLLVFRRTGDEWLIVAEAFSYAPPTG